MTKHIKTVHYNEKMVYFSLKQKKMDKTKYEKRMDLSNMALVFLGDVYYMYPNQRRMSLRLATTMSKSKMLIPTYSATTMNLSLGLRPVIIS